jgi:hypothetical protein
MKNNEVIDDVDSVDDPKIKQHPPELKKQSKTQELWEDVKFEIEYWWQNSIVYRWKTFTKGISNLWRWRKIVWRDRWWDYDFLNEFLLFKLKDMEAHWGVDTHYVNDFVEKDTLKKLIEDLEWLMDEDRADEFIYDENKDKRDVKTQYSEYGKEYDKRAKSFYGRLERHHRKFWD